MKNKILIIIAALFVMSSCEDVLDKQPLDKISDATFWLSPKDAKAGLMSCYDVLQCKGNTKNPAYELWGMMDLMTPVGASRRGDYNTVADGTHDPSNGLISNYWKTAYRGVVKCNDVITNIDNIPFTDSEKELQAQIKGEASFLRAMFYYQLVLAFGDVPLILDIQTVEESLVPRDAKDKVIAAMLADVEVAINSLPNTHTTMDIGRATRGAALTLKAKIQLMEKDWSGAAASLKDIIDSGNYSLQDDFSSVFNWQNENNSEVIFDIQFVSEAGDGATFDKLYCTRSHSAWGWTWVLPSLWLVDKYEVIDENPEFVIEDDRIAPEVYEYFEGRDPRMDATIIRPGAHTIVKGGVDKLYPYGIAAYNHSRTGIAYRKNIIEGDGGIPYDSPNNMILYRYADVLLMYAEAKKQLGQFDQATADLTINAIRARASELLPLYSASDVELEDIYDECIRELAFEGWLFPRFKRWDMMKLNDGIQIMGMANSKSSCNFATKPLVTRQFFDYHMVWPIPQTEREINPNLVQNPGYPE